jgi:hypothetical protein
MLVVVVVVVAIVLILMAEAEVEVVVVIVVVNLTTLFQYLRLSTVKPHKGLCRHKTVRESL